MFDIGWSEMGIIALVALVVMGPKELPNALRTFSHWMKQLRGMAREFQSGVDQLIREADLEDARKKLQEAQTLNINREIEKVVDPDRALQTALNAPAEAKTAEPKPVEPKPDEAKPAEPQAIESKPADAASVATETPQTTAEVKPFPLASAALNGASPHVNGADADGGGAAIGVAAPASANPAEMSDDPGVSGSRKAHG
jgi:sec-independent protein translocase protein TatB